MKKILFVAAVISLLNACSESVYELPNGSAGGTNNWDEIAHTPCNMANDKAFCTDSGNVMRCENNEWALATCSTGCKDGACIDKEQIKEESCKGEEIYSWCTADGHSLAFGCKHTHVKESGIIISTMTCAAGCNETTKECYDCDKDIKCCKEDDNTCQKICIDHRCIPKTTLSCMRKPTFKCDQGDSGQTYTLYCNESAIEGFVNVQCEGNKKCSENHQACVECINDGDCEELYPDKPTCNNGICSAKECGPDQEIDTSTGKCVPISVDDKCSLEGVITYLTENFDKYKDYINIETISKDNTCIISDGDSIMSALAKCLSIQDHSNEFTIKNANIIFCGTVQLNQNFQSFPNVENSYIFGVHDATITSSNGILFQPLFNEVKNSKLFKLEIHDIHFNIESTFDSPKGIIGSFVGSNNTAGENKTFTSAISDIKLNNISITSVINILDYSYNVGGFIGEADNLSMSNIIANTITVKATNVSSALGGLIGKAKDVKLSRLSMEGTDIKAYGYSPELISRPPNSVGGVVGVGENLTIDDGKINKVSINTDMECIGGIVGEASGNLIINTDSSTTTTIEDTTLFGKSDVGGLIGLYNGSESSELKLTHIDNNITSIQAEKDIAAGLIGTLIGSNTQIELDDIHNHCGATAESTCIQANNIAAGLIGRLHVSEVTKATISNIKNDFGDYTIQSFNSDAAGFITNIGIKLTKSGSIGINHVISIIGKLEGEKNIGGFINSIDFGDKGSAQLTINDITSGAKSYKHRITEQYVYNVATINYNYTRYTANQIDTAVDVITSAGFINNINNAWYLENNESLNNTYYNDEVTLYCNPSNQCINRYNWSTDHIIETLNWSNFSPNLYENKFTSKISVSNIAVKNDFYLADNTRVGQNMLSGSINKTELRACSKENAKDLNNAVNSIYNSNIFMYSIVEPCDGSDNCFDIHSSDVFHYNSPIKYCYYDDFANINIMYDMYCKDVNVAMTCDVVPEDAIIKNDRLVRPSDVPNRMEKGTWLYNDDLGLPVPALQGIVVKQAEPLPLEPIDPDDSREPAPDSPVEP